MSGIGTFISAGRSLEAAIERVRADLVTYLSLPLLDSLGGFGSAAGAELI